MVILDCGLICDRKWDSVLEGRGSLGILKGFTIFIKNIQHIPSDIQKKLEIMFGNTSIAKNNRLIFSFTEEKRRQALPYFCDYLLGSFGCVTICPPPLRERKKDIPSLASLYIGAENQKLATPVIGFEKNAIDAMKQFDWPGNITQLKRVLLELLLLTKNSYISERDIRPILKYEERCHSESSLTQLNGETLDEIVKSAIHSALAAENMNQTKAARRLGISRSTLWKKLKDE
jgi:DNA-binding NtrC family response regulator